MSNIYGFPQSDRYILPKGLRYIFFGLLTVLFLSGIVNGVQTINKPMERDCAQVQAKLGVDIVGHLRPNYLSEAFSHGGGQCVSDKTGDFFKISDILKNPESTK